MQLKERVGLGLIILGAGLATGWFWWRASAGTPGSWGIDAVLTRHASSFGRLGYQHRLSDSGVGVLRERDVGAIEPSAKGEEPSDLNGVWRGDVREQFRDLKQRGFKVVAFANLPFAAKPGQAGDQLAEDLLMVFKQGRFLGQEFAGRVYAWEMVGEPDIGYCTDLPDRVAAYQKALYLGLKAGARDARAKGEELSAKSKGQSAQTLAPSTVPSATSDPLVLMGALGMPPGPWLERAAANGLLDYTDAYNFHFYGHAADLTGVIEAHREAIRRLGVRSSELRGSNPSNVEHITPNELRQPLLPLWITEAGIETVSKDDFLNPLRRQLQADFTISTAKQALAAPDVAVFMPFILVHDNDPYAMTLSPWKTFPAWDAYAKFTKENPWPQRPLAREPREVNSVVVQWLPDNSTCVPHKASGTYRFKEGQSIKGKLRVFNFSDNPVQGRVESGRQMSDVRCQMAEIGQNPIEIPAKGMVSVPVEFTANAKGYFRETWSAAFVETSNPTQRELSPPGGSEGQIAKGAVSVVSFGLEAEARLVDFTEQPLALRPLPEGKIRFPQIAPYAPGQQVGVWTTLNGLKGEVVQRAESGKLKAEETESIQVSGLRSQVSSEARFWIERQNTDPLAPTMAVASVDGLPMGPAGSSELGARSNTATFIRLQLDKPMTKDRKVLLVLVDDRGQRYTIWENFGADYYGSRSDIWLNLEDFHADFWGPMGADYQFRPERIREVHLRLYLSTPNDPVNVKLTLLKAM